MRVRADVLVSGLVIALCALAVLWQLEVGPFAPEGAEEIVPLALGEVLSVDLDLRDAVEETRWRSVMDTFGRQATVFYTWSVPCPCIEVVEPRLRALHARFNADRNGVAWVALAGEPEDEPAAVRKKMGAIDAFYDVLLDPRQRLCRRLGFRRACQVAVLDAQGRLVYRGALDDDYREGHGEHLEEALAAVVAGRAPPVGERGFVYGCEFADPASCLEYASP